MVLPRTRPFQSLQPQRGNPQLQQLLQLIAQQSQRRPASGPPTALPTPFRQGISRAPLPPARVNPLNALDQAQRGAIPPGLLPGGGLPTGPQFVPGSEANVKGNFQSRAPGSVFSDITAGGVGPGGAPGGTPGIPNPIANPDPRNFAQRGADALRTGVTISPNLLPSFGGAPQVNRRSGPSPAAGAAAARGLQGFQLPGQQLKRLNQVASKNSGENIVTTAKGDVGPNQAKRIQDTAKQSAGVPKSAKNAPAWALPLMMMGLTMAASKRTDSLGAFSEGGLAGLQLFMQQKSTKRKAATEERKLRATEEKARAATTTARAATVTAEANRVAAQAKGNASGPLRKRFDDLQVIFEKRGQAGKSLKTDITPAELERIVTGLPDVQFEAFKVLLRAAADAQFLADKPLTTEQINEVADAARTAGGAFARTSGETPPAAVTGSRRTIGPEGIR